MEGKETQLRGTDQNTHAHSHAQGSTWTQLHYVTIEKAALASKMQVRKLKLPLR